MMYQSHHRRVSEHPVLALNWEEKRDGERCGELVRQNRKGSFYLTAVIFRANLKVLLFSEWIQVWGDEVRSQQSIEKVGINIVKNLILC